MSNTEQTGAAMRALVFRQPCPTCGAGPDARCVTKAGRPYRYNHAAREAHLWEAYQHGFDMAASMSTEAIANVVAELARDITCGGQSRDLLIRREVVAWLIEVAKAVRRG